LFSGTLAENIAYGNLRATQQQILAAARRANCDFIADFPDGLETEVGPRGAQLSGGQKQVPTYSYPPSDQSELPSHEH